MEAGLHRVGVSGISQCRLADNGCNAARVPFSLSNRTFQPRPSLFSTSASRCLQEGSAAQATNYCRQGDLTFDGTWFPVEHSGDSEDDTKGWLVPHGLDRVSEALLYPACECSLGLLSESLQRLARVPLMQLVLEPRPKLTYASFYLGSPIWAWEVGPLILGAGDVDWLLEAMVPGP